MAILPLFFNSFCFITPEFLFSICVSSSALFSFFNFVSYVFYHTSHQLRVSLRLCVVSLYHLIGFFKARIIICELIKRKSRPPLRCGTINYLLVSSWIQKVNKFLAVSSTGFLACPNWRAQRGSSGDFVAHSATPLSQVDHNFAQTVISFSHKNHPFV